MVDDEGQDQDVHDPVSWAGKILCSEPEREALHKLLTLGFQDTFRLFSQERHLPWLLDSAIGFEVTVDGGS